MNQTEVEIAIKPRVTEEVLIRIPVDAMRSLDRVANDREMSLEALLKFYIGQGLRQDLTKLFDELETKT